MVSAWFRAGMTTPRASITEAMYNSAIGSGQRKKTRTHSSWLLK
jgi:hypothetical protein